MVNPTSDVALSSSSLVSFLAASASLIPSSSSSGGIIVTTGIPAMTASAPSITSSTVNMTQIVSAQAGDQDDTNNSIPQYILYGFAGILFLCIILTQARFLARLFASLHPRARSGKSSSSSNQSQQTSYRGFNDRKDRQDTFVSLEDGGDFKRVVGGGELWKGWFLRSNRGKGVDHKAGIENPFSDVSDRHDIPPPIPVVKPYYYPPPHINPPLQNLPYATHILYSSPFIRFPSILKSKISLPALYLMGTYLIVILFALIWESDYSPTSATKGYGFNFVRPAFVGMTQVPVVIALGVRGNIIGQCVGKGYERLKVFHKFAGRLVFVCITFHAVGYFYRWIKYHLFSQYFHQTFVYFGLAGWGSLILIVITSMPFIRKACFGIFEVCHFIGLIGLLVGMAFHKDSAVPFALAGIFIYILSLVFTITKTRLATAELVALPSETTLITIPGIRSGWRAGQHVRLRVPALPFPYCLQSHPFTVASAPDSQGLMLLCKKAGDWTTKLFDHAESNGTSRSGGGSGQLGYPTSTATVLLEGPFGGLGNTLLPSFSAVLLIAGGSGISHSLGIAHDLITQAPSGVVRARTIELVWIVKTPKEARPMLETLSGLVEDAKNFEEQSLASLRRGESCAHPVGLIVRIYLTRCQGELPVDLLPSGSGYDGMNPGVGGAGVMFDLDLDGDREKGDPFGNRQEEIFELEEMENVPGLGMKRKNSSSSSVGKPYVISTATTRGESHLSPSTISSPYPRTPNSATAFLSATSYRSPNIDGETFQQTQNGKPLNQPQASITIQTGRPNVEFLLDRCIGSSIDRHRGERTEGCGICVVPCGPLGMVGDVRSAVKGVDGWKRKAVGGVEIEEEAFGY